MIPRSIFALHRIQAAIFTSHDDLRPSVLLQQVLREWGDTYNATPISLPLPAEAPPDLPGIVLSSEDQTQRLQISRVRVDALWMRQSTSEVSLHDVLTASAERLARIAEESGIAVGRLGAVVTRLAEYPSPGRVLAEQFCRDEWLVGPLNRPEGFELHAHKVYAIALSANVPGVNVNSWVRIKAAKIGSEPYRHVLVEQDINSLAEELGTRQFSRSELLSWFGVVGREFDSILARYFPLS